jgi:hypothetical protein
VSRSGDVVGGRFEIGEQVAYRGKQGCTDPRCTRRRGDASCFGWHCSRCHGPSSYQGHLAGGRMVDGTWRRFADGELRFSCGPDYLTARVEATA